MSAAVRPRNGWASGGLILLRGAAHARPITEVYDLRDPVNALRAIASAHGGAVRRLSPWLVIVTIDSP